MILFSGRSKKNVIGIDILLGNKEEITECFNSSSVDLSGNNSRFCFNMIGCPAVIKSMKDFGTQQQVDRSKSWGVVAHCFDT